MGQSAPIIKIASQTPHIMSLIVARKDSSSILVVSDTHLSFPDARAAADRQIRHPSTGVIKTLIINNDVAVSFAGGESYADDAFQLLSPNTSLDNVKNILLQAHLKSNQATDFIISVGNPRPQIFEIKDSKCLEVDMTWIGSKRAFAAFQSFMQGTAKSDRSNYVRIERVIDETQTDLFTMMSSAMDYVIENSSIPEVDGFRVNTAFTENKFQYTGYTHSYMSDQPLVIELPEGVNSAVFPITHGSAQSGAYQINFFRSPNPKCVGIHILQGNFGIIYQQKEGGLMRPDFVHDIDEVDFIEYAEDNYGIRPSMISQDCKPKCIAGGDEAFKQGDFRVALSWYNKALRHCYGKDKAIFHHRKAIAYANLGIFREVVLSLDEAVRSDPNYQKLAFSLMSDIQKRGVRL